MITVQVPRTPQQVGIEPAWMVRKRNRALSAYRSGTRVNVSFHMGMWLVHGVFCVGRGESVREACADWIRKMGAVHAKR
jgi:hypothetical protein